MKKLFFTLILCLWVSTSWAFPPGFIGAITQGVVTSSEYTLIIDQNVSEASVDFSTADVGTSFTLPGSATDLRITVPLIASGVSCGLRYDDDTDMSSEYIAGTTFTGTSGANVITLSGSFTSGTRYLILQCASGSFYRALTNVAPSIEYRYGTHNSWITGDTSSRDLVVKLEYK